MPLFLLWKYYQQYDTGKLCGNSHTYCTYNVILAVL